MIAREALAGGLLELCRLDDASGVHVTFTTEPEFRSSASAASAAHRPAVSLAECGLRHASTISSPRFRANARPSAANDTSAVQRRHRALAHRQRSHRSGLGRVFRLLHGYRLAQMGPALLTGILFAGRRKVRDRIVLVMAKRAGRWIAGAINFIGSHTLVRPALGRHGAPSVPAFRALLLSGHRLRHRTQAHDGEAGAQGEHKIARGYMPKPPIQPITSPIRRCGARSPIISPANAPMSRPPAPKSPPLAPYRKDLVFDPE